MKFGDKNQKTSIGKGHSDWIVLLSFLNIIAVSCKYSHYVFMALKTLFQSLKPFLDPLPCSSKPSLDWDQTSVIYSFSNLSKYRYQFVVSLLINGIALWHFLLRKKYDKWNSVKMVVWLDSGLICAEVQGKLWTQCVNNPLLSSIYTRLLS